MLLRRSRIVLNRSADIGDALGHGFVQNFHVRPDRAHQLFTGDQAAVALHEIGKDLE